MSEPEEGPYILSRRTGIVGIEGQETKNTAFVIEPDTFSIARFEGESSLTRHTGMWSAQMMSSNCAAKACDL